MTLDLDLATIYDLNYIRRVPLDCTPGVSNYSFVIKYNPENQSNIPKGF